MGGEAPPFSQHLWEALPLLNLYNQVFKDGNQINVIYYAYFDSLENCFVSKFHLKFKQINQPYTILFPIIALKKMFSDVLSGEN